MKSGEGGDTNSRVEGKQWRETWTNKGCGGMRGGEDALGEQDRHRINLFGRKNWKCGGRWVWECGLTGVENIMLLDGG